MDNIQTQRGGIWWESRETALHRDISIYLRWYMAILPAQWTALAIPHPDHERTSWSWKLHQDTVLIHALYSHTCTSSGHYVRMNAHNISLSDHCGSPIHHWLRDWITDHDWSITGRAALFPSNHTSVLHFSILWVCGKYNNLQSRCWTNHSRGLFWGWLIKKLR